MLVRTVDAEAAVAGVALAGQQGVASQRAAGDGLIQIIPQAPAKAGLLLQNALLLVLPAREARLLMQASSKCRLVVQNLNQTGMMRKSEACAAALQAAILSSCDVVAECRGIAQSTWLTACQQATAVAGHVKLDRRSGTVLLQMLEEALAFQLTLLLLFCLLLSLALLHHAHVIGVHTTKHHCVWCLLLPDTCLLCSRAAEN